MTKDEALQLALDSIKEIIYWYAVRDRNDVFLNFVDQNPEIQKIMKLTIAIKEALETKDEPVAYINVEERKLEWATEFITWETPTVVNLPKIPLYTTTKRTWVKLTDEEIEQIYMDTMSFQQNARTLEAKLKDKNVR